MIRPGEIKRRLIPRLPDPDALAGELRVLLTEMIQQQRETNAHLAAIRARWLNKKGVDNDTAFGDD